ncbi:cyclopropane-fatty-acyl-phospholipid synthase family protein [Methylophilus sp. 14]|uniref:SAM-dependent methyltransferase n=1 Tax=Methylophilus sp. 14 TaxID=2781019 RepID=UPI00188E23A5|nr:cyclopropane-fatty-acyl-phospholipid synthase family protein [Methylophilus sp. 14]MBF4987159.1 class I SAM-dependent methyltransferase [Methylophilus sp. 14]
MSSYPVNALDHLRPLMTDPGWQQAQPIPQDDGETTQVRLILNKLFQTFTGTFAVRLWNGNTLHIGTGSPAFTVCLEQASVLRDMVLFSDPHRLAEAYVAGDIQIQGDFHAAMQLQDYFVSLSLPLHEKLGLIFRALTLASHQASQYAHSTQIPQASTPAQSRSENTLRLDYNAPDDFYQLWLGEHRLHACAYFTGQSSSLAEAQQTQLDKICQALRLQHGNTLLDIDCGRGGLACWAAKHYGVFVHGITTRPDEYAYATRQVQAQGLSHLIKIELADISNLPATSQYDKAVNISMHSHVGSQQLPGWLATVHALLKPGGVFLSHAISSESAAWQQANSRDFINRHLSPQASLTTFSQRLQHMDNAKFDVFKVEGLQRHYVLTLRQWLAALETHHTAAAALVGERTYRLWRLYMTANVIQFEQGVTGIHQILATRR